MERDIDPNGSDNQYGTLLHRAVQECCDIEVVSGLLYHGANPNALDSYNRTPICYVEDEEVYGDDIVQDMIGLSCSPNLVPGPTALDYSVLCSRRTIAHGLADD